MGSASAHSAAGETAIAKRGGGFVGSPAGSVAAPSTGGRDRADAGPVPRHLPRLHGEAFPRVAGQAAQLHFGLHGDQAASAPCRPGAGGEEALGAPQEAAAPSDGGNDAAPGRLDACLAAGDAGKHDLVVTMEDATSAIYSAFLVDEEGTARVFGGCGRWWRSTACSAHSILTGAATIYARGAGRYRGRF